MANSSNNVKLAGAKRVRSCIACGVHENKSALHRFIRDPKGEVSFDATGKAAGRGAYVCSSACLEKACKSKKLDRALRVKLSAEDHRRLSDEFEAGLEHMDEE